MKLSRLGLIYLVGLLRSVAKQSCKRSNCGSICLCDRCAARYVLKEIE